MTAFGRALLIIALLAGAYAVWPALRGARSGAARVGGLARRAVYALAALLTLAVVVLEAAFLRSDFSFGLVADNSSTTTPDLLQAHGDVVEPGGLAAAVGLGALALLRASCCSRRAAAARGRARGRPPCWARSPPSSARCSSSRSSPFTTIANPPAEGAGLNPLLRHPSMMFHPPLLYSGYVGFSIPFAFAIGALAHAAGRTPSGSAPRGASR